MSLTKVVVENGEDKYVIRQTKGVYVEEIAKVTGISQQIDAKLKDEPIYEVAEIIRTGKAFRYQVVLQVGETKKRRDLLVALSKVTGIRENLLGKKIGQSEIIDILVKRDAHIK